MALPLVAPLALVKTLLVKALPKLLVMALLLGATLVANVFGDGIALPLVCLCPMLLVMACPFVALLVANAFGEGIATCCSPRGNCFW